MRDLLNAMSGTMGLMASLLYGTGMRLMEGLRLRVKDVEFSRREIIVREGKGNKDRVTVLPENVILPLTAHLEKVKALHERDLAAGFGEVFLPDALAVTAETMKSDCAASSACDALSATPCVAA